MAAYQTSTTTSVSTATNIITSGNERDVYEIFSGTTKIWVNVIAGGTATVAGANCIPVPAASWVEISLTGTGNISAIVDTGGAATNVTASLVQA